MNSKKTIDAFFAEKKIAIAGVSENKIKFGYKVYEALKKNNFEVYPINAKYEKIDDDKCYSSVTDIPEDVKNLIILTPKQATANVTKEAVSKGIKSIWFQQQIETKESLQIAREAGVDFVSKECIFMFLEPVKSIHSFHRFFKKLFGNMPK